MSSGNVAAASRIPTGMKYVTAYYIPPSVTLAKRWGGLIVRHQLHFKRLHPPFKRIQWKFNRATFYTRASSSPSSLPEILSLLLLSKENYLVELSLCIPAGCLTHPNLYPPFGEGKKKKKRKSRLQADKHLSNGVAVKAITGDEVDVNPADREPGSPLGPVAEEKKKGKGERKKERKSGGQPRSFKLSSLALSLSPPTGHPLRLFYLLLLLLLFFSFFFLFRAIHNLLYPRWNFYTFFHLSRLYVIIIREKRHSRPSPFLYFAWLINSMLIYVCMYVYRYKFLSDILRLKSI